jgi:hypothetical protein
VQQGLPLYPSGEDYPYTTNYMGPCYFWAVGMLGRAMDADIPMLYRIGRLVSFFCGLAPAVIAGVYSYRRWGRAAGLAAAALGLGAAPMIGFGVMTRPDMLADLLGLAGFFLACRSGVRGLALAGLLLALACLTKQTAGAYAIAAVLALGLADGRRAQAMLLAAITGAVTIGALVLLALAGEPQAMASFLGQRMIPWDLKQQGAVLFLLARQSPDLLWLPVLGIGLWMSPQNLSQNHHSPVGQPGDVEAANGSATGSKNRDRQLSILALVMLAAALVTIAKKGSDLNYFLGLRVVAAMGGGMLCQAALHTGRRCLPAAKLMFVSLLCLIPSILQVGHAARSAYGDRVEAAGPHDDSELGHLQAYQRLAQDPNVRLLTDHDALAVYQGQDVPLLDAYLFRLRVTAGQLDPPELVDRIRARTFQYVVLSIDVDGTYDDICFWLLPESVADAIRSNYRLLRRDRPFWVYVPRE